MSDPQADVAALVEGLWRRVRDVLLVAERVGSFTFSEQQEEPERAALTDAEIDAAAKDFVLRALAVTSDALNHVILTRSCTPDGVVIDELAKELATGSLVVSERVNDMLQLGLIARELDSGRARATPAGEAIVSVVAGVAGPLAERIRRGRDDAREGSGRDGLPLL